MSRKATLAALAAVVLLGVLASAAAASGKPTIDRIQVDESFPDGFLTDACGVPVTSHVGGHVIVRTFPDGTGVARIFSLNILVTATAGDNVYRFRDVGIDLVRIEPDGTAVLQIVGQIPFGFTGVLKIDLETGEAILEPHHTLEGDLGDACAALTA